MKSKFAGPAPSAEAVHQGGRWLGGKSRRKVQGFGAVLVAAGMAATSLTALGGATTAVAAPTPKYGGTLRLVGQGDVDFMDTANGYYDVSWGLFRAITRQLYTWPLAPTFAGQVNPVPDLATAMPVVTNGAKTYTITIRTGAMWDTSPPAPGDGAGRDHRPEAAVQPGFARRGARVLRGHHRRFPVLLQRLPRHRQQEDRRHGERHGRLHELAQHRRREGRQQPDGAVQPHSAGSGLPRHPVAAASPHRCRRKSWPTSRAAPSWASTSCRTALTPSPSTCPPAPSTWSATRPGRRRPTPSARPTWTRSRSPRAWPPTPPPCRRSRPAPRTCSGTRTCPPCSWPAWSPPRTRTSPSARTATTT